MPPQMTLLLLAALICWYIARTRQAEPIVRCCSRCGDLVQYAPGLPTRCPSCGAFTLI